MGSDAACTRSLAPVSHARSRATGSRSARSASVGEPMSMMPVRKYQKVVLNPSSSRAVVTSPARVCSASSASPRARARAAACAVSPSILAAMRSRCVHGSRPAASAAAWSASCRRVSAPLRASSRCRSAARSVEATLKRRRSTDSVRRRPRTCTSVAVVASGPRSSTCRVSRLPRSALLADTH